MKRLLYYILSEIIMILCHLQYKYYDSDIFYIKGIEKDDGKYMLYTERHNIADRMHKF